MQNLWFSSTFSSESCIISIPPHAFSQRSKSKQHLNCISDDAHGAIQMLTTSSRFNSNVNAHDVQ